MSGIAIVCARDSTLPQITAVLVDGLVVWNEWHVVAATFGNDWQADLEQRDHG